MLTTDLWLKVKDSFKIGSLDILSVFNWIEQIGLGEDRVHYRKEIYKEIAF